MRKSKNRICAIKFSYGRKGREPLCWGKIPRCRGIWGWTRGMKIAHLKTFLKVVASGSFTRAAQELFLTQPTVSNHIQTLEQELGRLFIRASSGLRLTPRGKRLARRAPEIFALLVDIKGDRRTGARQLRGQLNVAASSVMGAYFLPPYLKEMLVAHPEVEIRCHFGNSWSIAAWVQDGFVDVGFAPSAPGFSRLSVSRCLQEPCVVATSRKVAEALGSSLERQPPLPFILREKGTAAHEVAMRWLRARPWGAALRTPVILSDMEAIKKLVLTDGGLTIIPRCCIAEELELGRMVELSAGGAPDAVSYHMLTRAANPDDRENRVLRAFLALLRQNRGQRAGGAAGAPPAPHGAA